jgi:hypothetical protein
MPAGRNPDFDDLMQDFYTKGFLSQVSTTAAQWLYIGDAQA